MAKAQNWQKEIKRGSIQLCVLSLLQEEPMYGYKLISAMRERSSGYFDLKEGTIYPILYRLEKKKYVKSEWLKKDKRPPRNYYNLTATGKQYLKDNFDEWTTMVEATLAVTGKRGKPDE